ncbi:MAG: LysR family transcriptional regulator [Streptosporangiales bacterium]
MLNPAHLLTLQAVVRTGSFATAANQLGYTASAVSQQIASLERAVGVALFERSPRSARPTASAELLASRGEQVLGALERLRLDVAAHARTQAERFVLGVFPSAARLVLPALTRDPEWVAYGVTPRVEVAEPSALVSMLAGETLDAAVVYRFGRSACSWPSGIASVHLFDEPLHLVLPDGHPLAAEPVLAARQLDGVAWITHTPGTSGALSIERLCADAGFFPHVVAHCDDYTATLALVRSGIGAALVPSGALPESLDGLTVRTVHGLDAYRGVFALAAESDASDATGLLLERLSQCSWDGPPTAGAPAGVGDSIVPR